MGTLPICPAFCLTLQLAVKKVKMKMALWEALHLHASALIACRHCKGALVHRDTSSTSVALPAVLRVELGVFGTLQPMRRPFIKRAASCLQHRPEAATAFAKCAEELST